MSLEEQARVIAARDLRRGRDILIRSGTPGVVTRLGFMGFYTVEFRPVDDVDTRVSVRGLRNRDLTLPDAPPTTPTQPDRRAS